MDNHEPTKLTITYLSYIHGRCNEPECPVCRWWTPKGGPSPKSLAWNKKRVTAWLKERLTVLPVRSKPESPWWMVQETKEECYDKLRANR